MARYFGIVACVVGLVGVITAVIEYHVLAAPGQKHPRGWEVESSLSEKLKFRFGTLPKQPELPPSTAQSKVKVAAIATGCVAIALAVCSWIRREGISLGVIACFLGVAAIAWEQALLVFLLFVITGGPVMWFWWPKSEAN